LIKRQTDSNKGGEEKKEREKERELIEPSKYKDFHEKCLANISPLYKK
jgi:hypothetical protein